MDPEPEEQLPVFDALDNSLEVSPPHVYADNLIEWALQKGASDIFFSDEPEGVTIRVRRLGRLKSVSRLNRSYGHRVQNHLRVSAEIDPTAGIHTPAEGRSQIELSDGTVVDLRLSSMPTLFGQDLAVRIFDTSEPLRKLDELGMEDRAEHLRELLARPHGLLLVAGPTGHGKTSTLYSCIDYLADGTLKIHTLEDPVERVLPGVLQSQVDVETGCDFHDLLKACLRNSPDVVMVGEIRDHRTAETAIRAGLGGQLVLATVHAHTAAEAVRTMLAYGANRHFLADALIGVVAQRLIRTLCLECRVPLASDGPIPVPERVAEKLGGTQPQLYRAEGCSACSHDGFARQTAICEVLETDHRFAAAIDAGESAEQLEMLAIDAGMTPLVDMALLKAVRGETTANEIRRVTVSSEVNRLAEYARRAAATS
ncbi:GspE/PulE family protein [Candidatus Laterigemmans baculatus]|uniref:GspE/PulE family protein n=1 Tax=Candidatus Laterigemmans baculatus TaxID=2770505 RepID=UPI0013DACD07|nr:ATPase, T2SS/T4P/T4SS family [Candidatus Laterigemmans baculatus]